MIQVFLSYSGRDTAPAWAVRDELQARGVECFWYQNPETDGTQLDQEIPARIDAADLFVAFLSPSYLASWWCSLELDYAKRRDFVLGGRFIRLLGTEPVPVEELGSLRNRARIRAHPPLDAAALDRIGAALLNTVDATPEPRNPPRPPSFRNREDELAQLRHALTTTGGRDLWVVHAPPRMGKSWFLHQVVAELRAPRSTWTARYVDLRDHRDEVRFDPVRLLGVVLDVDVEHLVDEQVLTDADLDRFARDISARDRPELYVIDSAELVDARVAGRLRHALTAIRRAVGESRRPRAAVGLLIGTRRPDEWRGLGSDTAGVSRFTALHLTEFREDVVAEALAELPDRTFTAEERAVFAHRLHRLSEGLPALLVRSLEWADGTDFAETERHQDDDVFDQVVRPYVRRDILSPESILPTGDQRPAEALAVLREAFRALAPYRLFTQSHLSFHLETDRAFAEALDAVGWSRAGLLDALGRTSLCTQPVTELWHTTENPIRRLLYRYFHRTDAERARAHATARTFYEGWTASRDAGREQHVVFVECLWHEAARTAIEAPGELLAELPRSAERLAAGFAETLYAPGESMTFVGNRLRDDDELRVLLRGHPGLFDEVVKSVELVVGGGR